MESYRLSIGTKDEDLESQAVTYFEAGSDEAASSVVSILMPGMIATLALLDSGSELWWVAERYTYWGAVGDWESVPSLTEGRDPNATRARMREAGEIA